MTAPRVPNPATVQKLIDRLNAYAGHLDPATVNTICHRSRITPGPDGYPTGGDGGPRSHDTPRPTENVVLAHLHIGPDGGHGQWREPYDPVGAAALAWWYALRDATDSLRRAERARQLIVHLGDADRGRVNTVDLCTECGEPAPTVRRINNAPYCAPSLGPCWEAARKRVQRMRGEG